MSIVRQLLDAGLLDELHLFVHPATAGSGLRLFEDGGPPRHLTLMSSEPFKTGVVYLTYSAGPEPANRIVRGREGDPAAGVMAMLPCTEKWSARRAVGMGASRPATRERTEKRRCPSETDTSPACPAGSTPTSPTPRPRCAFYGGLFGWEFEDVMPEGSGGQYFIGRIRGGDVAAVGSRPEGAPPMAVWNTYIWVDERRRDGGQGARRRRRRGDGAVRRHGRGSDGGAHRSRGRRRSASGRRRTTRVRRSSTSTAR